MPQLYNVETREPEDLEGDALQQALASGTHAYPSDAMIAGTNPAGRPWSIPSADVQAAVANGYHVESPFENAVRSSTEKFQADNPYTGPIRVAGSAATNALAFDIPDMLAHKYGDPLKIAQDDAIKKAYPISNFLGGATGTAISLATPIGLEGNLLKTAGGFGKLAEQVAGRLAATGAVDAVGTRVLGRTAKDIVANWAAKTAGSAVEGSLLMVPHAAGEAVLGDPHNAAESLLAGGIMGGVMGGAVSPALKGIYKVGVKGAEIATKIPELTEGVLKKFANMYGGTPEEISTYYAENAPRINQAPPPEAPILKDMLDGAVQKRIDAVNVAKEAYETAEKHAGEAYQFAKMDLRNERAPLDIAADLQASIEGEHQTIAGLKARAAELHAAGDTEVTAKLNDHIAEREQTLNQTEKHFGDPSKAVASLNKIHSPSGDLKADVLQKFSDLTGEDYPSRLEDLKSSKELLERSKVQDIRPELIPEAHAKAEMARAQYLQTVSDLNQVKKITPNFTDTGFNRKLTPDTEKALNALSEADGQNYTQMVKDRQVLNFFPKDKTNGSRLVQAIGGAVANLGALGGGALGGALGGGAGAAAGAAGGYALGKGLGNQIGAGLDKYGGMAVKKFIDSGFDKGGLLYVEQQMKKAAEHLDKIPGILNNMSEKTYGAGLNTLSIGAMGRVIQKDYEPNVKNPNLTQKEKIKHLEKVSDSLSNLVSNPVGASDHFSSISAPISKGGAPDIGGAFAGKMALAANYLHSAMPKPPNPTSPFAPKVPFRPSDSEISAFEQKLSVVQDPFIVLKELEHGTLTKNHMDALKTVYPYLHSEMQKRVQQAVINGVKPIPYQKRVKLSLLMEAPMDSSMTPASVNYFQSFFAMNPQGMDEKNGFKVDLAKDMQTDSQRITQG